MYVFSNCVDGLLFIYKSSPLTVSLGCSFFFSLFAFGLNANAYAELRVHVEHKEFCSSNAAARDWLRIHFRPFRSLQFCAVFPFFTFDNCVNSLRVYQRARRVVASIGRSVASAILFSRHSSRSAASMPLFCFARRFASVRATVLRLHFNQFGRSRSSISFENR